MTPAAWIATRLAAALFAAVVFVTFAYYVIAPAVVKTAYRLTREGPELDRFKLSGGRKAAGSEDAVYYAALFDCRNAVTRITGPAPDALYWMIGIYDNRLQRIPGGHLNDAAVEIDDDGQFRIVIQPGPGNLNNTLECREYRTGLIIYRVFLPRSREEVLPPAIERIPTR
jgi:uncharacterized membrane protein